MESMNLQTEPNESKNNEPNSQNANTPSVHKLLSDIAHLNLLEKYRARHNKYGDTIDSDNEETTTTTTTTTPTIPKYEDWEQQHYHVAMRSTAVSNNIIVQKQEAIESKVMLRFTKHGTNKNKDNKHKHEQAWR